MLSDSLSCGRRFRILNVIDDFSRECLAAVVDYTTLSNEDQNLNRAYS